jgi:putative membrane protein insertion efficiency factor
VTAEPPLGRTQGWALRAIEWYQRLVEGRPSPCRFFPSCSSYAAEAFEVHGTARGLRLTIRRLVRCRPFGPSGFDPVPEPATNRPSGDAAARTERLPTPASPAGTSAAGAPLTCEDC